MMSRFSPRTTTLFLVSRCPSHSHIYRRVERKIFAFLFFAAAIGQPISISSYASHGHVGKATSGNVFDWKLRQWVRSLSMSRSNIKMKATEKRKKSGSKKKMCTHSWHAQESTCRPLDSWWKIVVRHTIKKQNTNQLLPRFLACVPLSVFCVCWKNAIVRLIKR